MRVVNDDVNQCDSVVNQFLIAIPARSALDHCDSVANIANEIRRIMHYFNNYLSTCTR